MVGRDVLRRYRVVNHSAHDASTLAPAGQSADGEVVRLNREYVEADPGRSSASSSRTSSPASPAAAQTGPSRRWPTSRRSSTTTTRGRSPTRRSTWGGTTATRRGDQRHTVAAMPLDLLVKLTVNKRPRDHSRLRGIDGRGARAGVAFSRETAMVAVPRPFPSWSLEHRLSARPEPVPDGEGLSAAARRIAQEGGSIVAVNARLHAASRSTATSRSLLFGQARPARRCSTRSGAGLPRSTSGRRSCSALIRLKAAWAC